MTSAARRFFDGIAGRYERAYALPSGVSRERMRAVLAHLPTAPGAVLDLGVGTGRELGALQDAGYAPTGVDVSPAMIERCARRARPVPLVLADFWEALPFEDERFDAALALHGTLAHPPDPLAPARLGAELARVVRPGGVLVAEVPSPAWLDRLPELPSPGDRVVRRTGPATCAFEDRVAGVTIDARILSAAEWEREWSAGWVVRVEAMGDVELRLVACRRTSS